MPLNFVPLLMRIRRVPVQEAAPKRAGSAIGKLVETPQDLAMTVLRVTLGAVMFVHASQKVFGWFGGPGIEGTLQGFTGKMGIPMPLAILVVLAEFLGSIGLIVGFLGRIAALGILSVMVGAIALVHHRFGFFMNWMGAQPGEGFEYHLLAIAMALAVIIRGSGALSVDSWITCAREKNREAPAGV
jgi:putative oxidoreductase